MKKVFWPVVLIASCATTLLLLFELRSMTAMCKKLRLALEDTTASLVSQTAKVDELAEELAKEKEVIRTSARVIYVASAELAACEAQGFKIKDRGYSKMWEAK